MEPLRQKDPKSIGPYTLIGRLGAGGMGIVYLATRDSESVALKVIRESLIDDPSEATRFTREIEALQKIDSPHVARILASGVDDDRAWFATEFVNGPDLKSLVSDKGPLPDEAWFKLADGLLEGLKAIHQAGIIHRDVKPGNIIMAESGPKLIDFGIAQVSDATSITSSGLVAGSPAWFSPEQIEGQSLTPSTDLFSAGSVLVFAAKGSSPWGDESTMTKASVFRVLTSEPDTSGLSESQLEIVLPLLAKEPTERYVTARADVEEKGGKASGREEGVSEDSKKGVSRASKSPSWPGQSARSWVKIWVGGGIFALVAGILTILVLHFIPSSGPLTVYLVNRAEDYAPSRLDISLALSDQANAPKPQSTLDRTLLTSEPRKTELPKWKTGLEWRANQNLFIKLSGESGALIEKRIDLSEHVKSGLIRRSEIGIQIFVDKGSLRLELVSPQITPNGVQQQTTFSSSVARTNVLENRSSISILNLVEGITLESEDLPGATVFKVSVNADEEILRRPELRVKWMVLASEDRPTLGDCGGGEYFDRLEPDGLFSLTCEGFDPSWRESLSFVKFFVVYNEYGRNVQLKWNHLGNGTSEGQELEIALNDDRPLAMPDQ